MSPTDPDDRSWSISRFVVVTFGVSWFAGGLAALGNLDVVDLPAWVVGTANLGFLLGPAIGALSVRAGRPRGAARATFDELGRPPAWRWCGLALAGGGGGAVVVVALLLATGAPPDALGTGVDWLATPAVLVGTTLAAVVEETGWRGTLLPMVRPRLGHRCAILLVGAIWGVWHLPLLLTDEGVNADVPIYAYPALALGLSAVLTWVYDAAGQSVASAALAHGALNATMAPVLAAAHSSGDLDHFYAVAVVVSVVAGAVALAQPPRGSCETAAHR